MRLGVAIALACVTIVGLSRADESHAAARRSTDIPAQGLGPALQALANDRNFQLVYVSEDIDTLRTAGIVGEFTPDEALTRLLSGTGLTYRYIDEKTVTIVLINATSSSAQPSSATSPVAGSSSSDLQALAPVPVAGDPSREETEEKRRPRWSLLRLAQADRETSRGSSAATSAGERPSESRSDQFEEVVVTARRAEESIQSVPVAITAFSAEDLRENSVTNPDDLQMTTPGVYLFGASGRQNTTFIIRGQSRGLGSVSPGVIPYFAEVPNPYLGNFVPQFDLSSIQVLKGPQGTLFGRNTTGGAILYTPAAPTDNFEGYVQAGYGDYDDRKVEAVVNLPASDTVSFRFGVSRHLRDGYTRDLNHPHRNLDDVDDTIVRGTMRIEPFAGLVNTTVVDYFKSTTNGFGANLIEVLPAGSLLSQLGIRQSYLNLLAQQQARGPRELNVARELFEHNKRTGVTNRTEWDLGGITLINIFGYRDTEVAFNTDSGTPRAIADGTGFLPAGTPLDLITSTAQNQTHQYSDELQLRGTSLEDRLQWLAGAFYLESNPSGPQSNLVGFAQIPGFDTATTSYSFIAEKSKALFGNVRYNFDDLLHGLQLEVGLRHTWDDIRSCTATGGPAGDIQPSQCDDGSPLLVNPAVTNAESKAWTWSVGVNWQATDGLFTYLVSRRGYRAGTVNSPALVGRLTRFQGLAPETVTDVELGLRSDTDLGSVKLRFNIDGFAGWYDDVHSAVTGLQTSPLCVPGIDNPAPVSPDGDCNASNDPTGGTLLVNAGRSRVSGIDLDGLIQLGERFSINYGGSILWSKLLEFTPPAEIVPYSPARFEPTQGPKRTAVLGARYALPMPASAGNLIFNVDYYWSDELPFAETVLPSYHTINARIDWKEAGGLPVDVAIFARNLFDEEYFSAGAVGVPFLGFTSAIYGPPRMVGAELRYQF
jgi:iron complex outermembrane receptor protein